MSVLSAKLRFAMADFSFSFDSDNPFAEPEATPKKAATAGDETANGTSAPDADATAPTAPVADAPASDDGEFSLDSFDFAFDEDASINDSLPTRNTPLDETFQRQLTPGEAAFAEFDFGASESTATPQTQAPEVEAPEVETPEFSASEIKDSAVESESSAPSIEVPEVEVPEFSALEVEAPAIEATEAEAPEIEIPDFSASEANAPEVEMPELETSEAEEPFAEVEMPEFSAPKVETLDAELPEAEAPELSAPAVETLETKGESEIAADEASSSEARSDLEEFNAFTYDFGMPDDLFADDSDAGESIASDSKIESATGEAAPEVASLDFDDAQIADAQTADTEVADAEVADAEVAEISMEAPAVARDVTDDAPLVAEAGEGQTESEFRRLKTRATLNVAVLGASGIGKNHARWFHRHGCQIVGFLGTSPETTTQTETDLSADFDFQGNAYTDLETLLQTEKPDIVCVATPPPLHFGHVLQSLEAGAHVLCEKPLVYAPTRKFRENRDGAKELVKVAAKRKLNLGTQLQYAGATPILCKLAGLTPSDVGDFAMELETTNLNSPRDPRELWIDLGPHPVSVAQMLAGTGSQLAEETIVFEPFQDDEKTEVLARFGINCADGRLLMVRAVVRALRGENPRKPRRRFSFNGHAVTYAPLTSAKNGFQAQFVAPDGYASVYPDPVDYLIGNFVNSCRNGQAPMISGDFGRENLEWMLKIGMPDEAR